MDLLLFFSACSLLGLAIYLVWKDSEITRKQFKKQINEEK
jgi:hypothetical protein